MFLILFCSDYEEILEFIVLTSDVTCLLCLMVTDGTSGKFPAYSVLTLGS